MEHSFKNRAGSGDEIRQSVRSLFSEIRAGLLSASEDGRVGFERSEETARVMEGWGRAEKDAGTKQGREAEPCRGCGLFENRARMLPGRGDPRARLMFAGNWPEWFWNLDETPDPEGALFLKIVQSTGIDPGRVRVVPLAECPAPGGRRAFGDEIQKCRPSLMGRIQKTAPDIICAMGAEASAALLGKDFPFLSQRGRFHDLKDDRSRGPKRIRVMPTHHPAALLKDPGLKREAWEDIKKIIKEYNR